MTENISLVLREAAMEGTVLLYALGTYPYFEELVKKSKMPTGSFTLTKGRGLKRGLWPGRARERRRARPLAFFSFTIYFISYYIFHIF